MVIFSKKYASSTWCLDELVAIHNCFQELDHMVIPVFYEIDPSHVRKQTREFGEIFKNTCEGKSDEQKQRWIQALTEVANIAGYDSLNQKWENEAEMIEQISNDVSIKLFTTSGDEFANSADFVGINAHLEAMESILRLESEEARMVGIVGTSGIGKSTIARALFSRLYSRFDHRAYEDDFRRTNRVDYGTKLDWATQFLSKLLGQKDIEISNLGALKERLKHNKVHIVLDSVDAIEILESLVQNTEGFGPGSRIIVVTQDKSLLSSHGVDISRIYEVPFPSREVALEMFCRSAFEKSSPPDGFRELAVNVANLTGNLPLALRVLGSSLRRKSKMKWEEMMPMLRDGLEGKIRKPLEFSYDRLDSKEDQELFLWIACLFNGESVDCIKNLLEGVYTSFNTRLRKLADKSLIRITALDKTVEMHILLQKLGREIGKGRFLLDEEEIRDVLINKSGTENVLGICLNTLYMKEPLVIDENSFGGMHNLQFIKFYGWWGDKLELPRGLNYLPRKLRLLHWDYYPGKYLPSSFRAECLVELIMQRSKLEKLRSK